MLHTKKGRWLFALALSVLYLLLFFLHYEISLHMESDLAVEIVSYIIFLLIAGLSSLCACVFFQDRDRGGVRYLWFLLFLSTRLFYQIPYYYIDYITAQYSSMDAIILGALMGLFELVAWYIVFALLSRILSCFKIKQETGVMWLCLVMPIYEFVLLMVEVVLYFASYGAMIYTDDIFYFIFGFLYPALLFAVSFFSSIYLLKLLNIQKIKGE